MTQPEWKYLGNLGDANPIDYGGYFIFQDTTGHYPPEGELYEPETGTAYRIILDKLALLPASQYLVSESLNDHRSRPLPYEIETYREWFDEKLPEVAAAVGITPDALRAALCSDDILERAAAYENLADYFGWFNFDQSPIHLTAYQAAARYEVLKPPEKKHYGRTPDGEIVPLLYDA